MPHYLLWKSPMMNFNNMCGTDYGICGKLHLWCHVDQTSFWSVWLKELPHNLQWKAPVCNLKNILSMLILVHKQANLHPCKVWLSLLCKGRLKHTIIPITITTICDLPDIMELIITQTINFQSLHCSQEYATGPSFAPDESSPYPHILFPWKNISVLPSHSLTCYKLKLCCHKSSSLLQTLNSSWYSDIPTHLLD
jgi:hypothetical protein